MNTEEDGEGRIQQFVNTITDTEGGKREAGESKKRIDFDHFTTACHLQQLFKQKTGKEN